MPSSICYVDELGTYLQGREKLSGKPLYILVEYEGE